ncbi:hypothetical protein FNV43_RR19160 [Rhamnella rubrinervis]|uniref:Uncharacterized protein n=1 Tax=Rhamnella rubrinervis TaxID=2594499 RepID=A0A8K0GW92_9ROSA|nr:hypothetical protein FNV43_RR19160 [Rhamnella rubrinervis]
MATSTAIIIRTNSWVAGDWQIVVAKAFDASLKSTNALITKSETKGAEGYRYRLKRGIHMGETVKTLEEYQGSLAAPLIFMIVIAFQILSRVLEHLKKKESKSARETQLRAEIKQLLKEASSLSQPSTFAQAAKLRRLAVAKEKELANYKDVHKKEMKLSCDLYLKGLFISKVLTYCILGGFYLGGLEES